MLRLKARLRELYSIFRLDRAMHHSAGEQEYVSSVLSQKEISHLSYAFIVSLNMGWNHELSRVSLEKATTSKTTPR